MHMEMSYVMQMSWSCGSFEATKFLGNVFFFLVRSYGMGYPSHGEGVVVCVYVF